MRLRMIRQHERRFRQIHPVKVTTTYQTVRVAPPDEVGPALGWHGVVEAAIVGTLVGTIVTTLLIGAVENSGWVADVVFGSFIGWFIWNLVIVLVIRPLAELVRNKGTVKRVALLGGYTAAIDAGGIFFMSLVFAEGFGFNGPRPGLAAFGWVTEILPFLVICGISGFAAGAAFALLDHSGTGRELSDRWAKYRRRNE